MTKERIDALNSESHLNFLTDDEYAAGWHYCPEFDDLLVGPGMGELHNCTCECAKHVPRPPVEPMDPTAVF